MKLILSILLTSLCVLSQERDIYLNWESIKDAKWYEIQIKKEKKLILKNIVNKNETNLKLNPGKYSLKLRSLDSRKVPGVWGEPIDFNVLIPKMKLDYPTETYNNEESIYLNEEIDLVKVSINNESFEFKNTKKIKLKLKNGINSISFSYENKGNKSEKTEFYILKKIKLSIPNLRYFSNYIEWDSVSNADYYELVLNDKKIKTKSNKIKINTEQNNHLLLKAKGNEKYKEDSECAEYNYDPKVEKYFNLPKKSFYLDYRLGSFSYENIFMEQNSNVNFKNLSGEGFLGFRFVKDFGIDFSIGYGGFLFNKVPVQYLDFKSSVFYKKEIDKNDTINFGISFFRKEYFHIYADQSFFVVDKKNKLLISGLFEYHHVFNQKVMSSLKTEVGSGFLSFDGKVLFRKTNNWVYFLGMNYSQFSIESVSFTNNYGQIGLQYWINQ